VAQIERTSATSIFLGRKVLETTVTRKSGASASVFWYKWLHEENA
jgi:hypothetical protein